VIPFVPSAYFAKGCAAFENYHDAIQETSRLASFYYVADFVDFFFKLLQKLMRARVSESQF
jgi:hypothetical protein